MIKMEDISWVEVKEALENGFDTVIVPIGSIEQHGPHLPLGTDTFISEVLAVRIAEKLSKTLVTPPITPGCSQHHME
ncbi:MAG: creatininase family protein [Candidatus Methanomethylicia archaeon]